jgi:hypothetical protein
VLGHILGIKPIEVILVVERLLLRQLLLRNALDPELVIRMRAVPLYLAA